MEWISSSVYIQYFSSFGSSGDRLHFIRLQPTKDGAFAAC